MNHSFKTFFKHLTLFSLILAVLAFVIFKYLIPQFYIRAIPFMFVYFIILTIITFLIYNNVLGKRIGKFAPYLMSISMLKLILSICIVFAYGFLFRATIVQFAISFLLLYMFYFAFQLFYTMKLLKMDANKK